MNMKRSQISDNLEKGSAARKDAARRLATKNEERQTTFIVRGPAGSGKSTLINTILGEEIMPTSSNEACTTVPTKILYSSAPDEYRAEIQFVAKDEWTAELQAYCTARRQESDTLPSNGSAPASAISTQLRDKSLEPWDATEARFSLDATIAKLSALFPRTGDCNAACNEAAARYIRDYDFMWVCLDICRAKSNKEMEAVFADLSDEQLQSGRGRISFVLTKCEQGCKILDKGSIRPIHQDVPSLLNDPVFNKKHREYQAVVEATRQMQKRVGGSGRAPRKATKSAILELEALSNTKRDCRHRRMAFAKRWGHLRKVGAPSISEALQDEFGGALDKVFDHLRTQLEAVNQEPDMITPDGAKLTQQIGSRWTTITGSSHWKIVKNATNHLGVHPHGRLNINRKLALELIKHFESRWNQIVTEHISSLRTQVTAVLNDFTEKTVASGLTKSMRVQFLQSIKQSEQGVERILKGVIKTFEKQGRESRVQAIKKVVALKIASKLKEAYADSAEYSGRGSTFRRRDRIQHEILGQKSLFDCTAADFDVASMVADMQLKIRQPMLDLGNAMEEKLMTLWAMGRDVRTLKGDEKKALETAIDLSNDLRSVCTEATNTLEACLKSSP
ncbi:uncharacterized protein PSFLO_07320 [Pseudozyma flocculosa]|uniref:G domain-containing protein n=1 Tax=Pseudozyma flocculosa TaxID=84751 RepID=A0A5C3FBW8_9BASI|nr:uncharacterized protein PSFLO_07320 [Pseudozyma flocculosa]